MTTQKEKIETLPLYINCDMGEWDAPHLCNLDHAYMPYIDLCNVACGAHAGTSDIMTSTIALADRHEVMVGAHPGYNDRKNFGRNYIRKSKQELEKLIISQIDLFLRLCADQDVLPYHVKPHGALYHACNHNDLEVEVLIHIMKNRYSHLVLLVYPNSKLHDKAKSEMLNYIVESFVDRRYLPELTLMPRSEKNAVITDVNIAKNQYDDLNNHNIKIYGRSYDLFSDTACIHGDNPNALKILQSIHSGG